MKLSVKKLHPLAVVPVRGTPYSAGLDLHVLEDVTILPGETKKLATGLAMAIPRSYCGIIRPRSSAFSRGLVVQGLIDADYRGEVFVVATNCGPGPRNIAAGASIAQMVLFHFGLAEVVETTELDATERGTKGFGSTGRTGGSHG